MMAKVALARILSTAAAPYRHHNGLLILRSYARWSSASSRVRRRSLMRWEARVLSVWICLTETREDHSALMLAALMIGPHRSVSARAFAASSTGVELATATPNSSNFAVTAASPSIATMSACIF
jgi:hypothetical protein